MKLYGSPISPRVRRVAVCAAELGLPLETVTLNIAKRENQGSEYLAKNPMGKVPTFEDDDGWLLWESCAIVAYLGEKHSEKGLYPTDLRERSDAMRWLFWCTAHIDPSIARLFAQRILAPMRGRAADLTVVADETTELSRFLPLLEQQLSRRRWLLGDHFSLVDAVVGVSVSQLVRPEFEFDCSAYPTISAWLAALAQRPSWRAMR